MSKLVEVDQLTPDEFQRFQGVIYQRSGIKIGDRKISLLSNRIRRRLRACGFDDFDSYFRFLTSPNSGEWERFLDAITTHETSFFRTAMHFEWLNTTFLPEIITAHRRGGRSNRLRLWSAACASGAEPYSLAISMAENKHRMLDWSCSILGTDISAEELKKARAGIYKSRLLDSVSADRRRRFFKLIDDESWEVKRVIRDQVEFATHNLMRPAPAGSFDCILLCNVLIYFDEQSKQTVLHNLIEALAPGGYLLLGPSEGAFDLLGELERHASCIYQKV